MKPPTVRCPLYEWCEHDKSKGTGCIVFKFDTRTGSDSV